jgi:hypothetical protein
MQEADNGLTIRIPRRDEIENVLSAIAEPQVSRLRRIRRSKKK